MKAAARARLRQHAADNREHAAKLARELAECRLILKELNHRIARYEWELAYGTPHRRYMTEWVTQDRTARQRLMDTIAQCETQRARNLKVVERCEKQLNRPSLTHLAAHLTRWADEALWPIHLTTALITGHRAGRRTT